MPTISSTTLGDLSYTTLVPAEVLRETITLCTDADFADAVAGSQTPTLVVGGAGDGLFSPQTLQDGVVAPLSRARREVLDCGHEIPVEAAEELGDLVSRFLADFGPDANRPARTRAHA